MGHAPALSVVYISDVFKVKSCLAVAYTALKVSIFWVILVCIFQYSDWITTRITPNTDTFQPMLVVWLNKQMLRIFPWFLKIRYWCMPLVIQKTHEIPIKTKNNELFSICFVAWWLQCYSILFSFQSRIHICIFFYVRPCVKCCVSAYGWIMFYVKFCSYLRLFVSKVLRELWLQ